jgi:hypothetical protein
MLLSPFTGRCGYSIVFYVATMACGLENVNFTWHNQVDMKLAVRSSHCSDLAPSAERFLRSLLNVSGKVVILSFRGTRIQVLAAENPDGQRARSMALDPVTDLVHLELLTGVGESPDWRRPVLLHAIIESRSDPLLAVRRASRWASYSARVAVVPQTRLNDRALLEAQLRGVWVVAASASGHFATAAAGERTSAAGSVRGLSHRLLDEQIWEALREQKSASTGAVRSAATR